MTRSSLFLTAIVGATVPAAGLLPRVAARSRQSGATQAASPAIDAIVERSIKAGKVAGASVAVTRRGESIVSKSYGSADLELDVPMPADASFEIGSVTKQFTAASILLLAERGKLSVDDDVNTHLPEYPTRGQHMTIRHLTTLRTSCSV